MNSAFRLPLLCCFLLLSSLMGVAHSQIPDNVAEDLRQGKAELEGKFKEAQKTLLAAFDKRIDQARNASKLSASERQDAIGAIEAEKAIFDKLDRIPFSPVLRTDAIAYLNTIQKAEIALGKLYDRAIDAQTKLKADASARELIADKKVALAPKLVGRWSISDSNGKSLFSWPLLSDGTTGKGTWTLDQNNLVKRYPDPKAPGGAWIDVGTVSASGREMKVKNNNGTSFRGMLSVDSR